MKRREFIAGLGSAVAWPLAAFAQRGQRQRRLGMLLDLRQPALDVFRWEIVAKRLEELGWIEGRNLIIDRRFAGGDLEQARAYARELVALNLMSFLRLLTWFRWLTQRQRRYPLCSSAAPIP